MKIGLFNEIQNPRPWPEATRNRGAGEFSLSSAPELIPEFDR